MTDKKISSINIVRKKITSKGVIMTVSKEEWLVTLNMELAMMKRNNESQLKKLTSLFQQSERQLEKAISVVERMEI